MFNLGDRKVGDGAPCFITFEAGPTHSGLKSAKRLINHAAEAGADAVKFQIFDPDRLVSDRTQLFTYDVLVDRETGRTETVSEPLYDLFVRRSLTESEWRELKAHSDSLGLLFFATVGFSEEVRLAESLGCHSIKIASADVNHVPLIREVAKTGLCVQLDTGSSTLGEIEEAVDLVYSEGNENVIVHHCPSGYPAHLESINLQVIPTLKRALPCPIAFSDHTPGWEMDIAAITLGANMVEKTITEDRMTRSVEHVMSLEPSEMKRFVEVIRDLEVALGSPRRFLSEEEKEKRTAIRRSIFLRRPLAAGHILTEQDLDYRRPGFGLPPKEADHIIGMKLSADKSADTPLSYKDLIDGS